MNDIRKSIIGLLSDDYGMSEDMFNEIIPICEENNWNDILDMTISNIDDRYYISQEDASNLLNV